MQVFGKVKIYETKTRLTFLTSVTMPIQTKQPFLEYENGIDRYIVRGNLIFDIFFIPTIRLTLVGGNDFDFDMAVDKMYYRFRPSAEFNAQLIQYKKIRCSAGVDFNWMYGDNGFINFGAREYVAATYNLAKHLNINANFNYFFIGKNIGAGYYITGGMRYLF